MKHEEVVSLCRAMDKASPLIYVLDNVGPGGSFGRLGWSAVSWAGLDDGEKLTIMRQGNFFFSAEDAGRAIAAALVASEEKAMKLLELLTAADVKD